MGLQSEDLWFRVSELSDFLFLVERVMRLIKYLSPGTYRDASVPSSSLAGITILACQTAAECGTGHLARVLPSVSEVLASPKLTWGFAKIGSRVSEIMGVPVKRIIVFWGLYFGPLIY